MCERYAPVAQWQHPTFGRKLARQSPPTPGTCQHVTGRRLGMDLTPLRTSRDFALVFTGAGVSGLGSFITYVSIPYQVYLLTDDPVLVGLLGVCELVPLLLMAFVGGALADYVDRRRLIIVSELAFTLLTGVLLVNALVGSPRLWLLFVIAGLSTAVDGLQRPAMDAIIPRL